MYLNIDVDKISSLLDKVISRSDFFNLIAEKNYLVLYELANYLKTKTNNGKQSAIDIYTICATFGKEYCVKRLLSEIDLYDICQDLKSNNACSEKYALSMLMAKDLDKIRETANFLQYGLCGVRFNPKLSFTLHCINSHYGDQESLEVVKGINKHSGILNIIKARL